MLHCNYCCLLKFNTDELQLKFDEKLVALPKQTGFGLAAHDGDGNICTVVIVLAALTAAHPVLPV